MKIAISSFEREIFAKIGSIAQILGMEAWVIGGFVRDSLLDTPSKDADIVCTGNGIDLAHAVAESLNPKPKVSFFKNFGTAHFRFQDFDFEFVGARKESYAPNSRNPIVQEGTINDDQLRRDFTINALAFCLMNHNFGEVTDPFNGLEDLRNKRIVTPLEPGITFCDDPLRMMRAIRFACRLEFNIDPTTFNGIKANCTRIKIVSKERITEELNKILACNKPSVGFSLLKECGLLDIIFPQLVLLTGAEFIDGVGHKDNFTHTLQVLDNVCKVSNNIWLRWAALLHDIAKPATKKFEPGIGWTFHGHEALGARWIPRIFGQFKLPLNEKMKFVAKLVELHLRPISLTKENITDSAIRRLLYDAGQEFYDLMLLCEADITTKNLHKAKRYVENLNLVKKRCAEVEEKDRIREWQPPIGGIEIIQTFGIPPSKPVGIIKTAIKDAILDGEIENTYQAAYQLMLRLGNELGLKLPE